jgi:multidrug resistance efflux pump
VSPSRFTSILQGATTTATSKEFPAPRASLDSLLPPENATGNYVKVVQRLPVRTRLYPGEDLDRRLRAGMSVEPTVWVTEHPQTLW